MRNPFSIIFSDTSLTEKYAGPMLVTQEPVQHEENHTISSQKMIYNDKFTHQYFKYIFLIVIAVFSFIESVFIPKIYKNLGLVYYCHNKETVNWWHKCKEDNHNSADYIKFDKTCPNKEKIQGKV